MDLITGGTLLEQPNLYTKMKKWSCVETIYQNSHPRPCLVSNSSIQLQQSSHIGHFWGMLVYIFTFLCNVSTLI